MSSHFEDISDNTLASHSPNRNKLNGEVPSITASLMPSPVNATINVPEKFDFKEANIKFKDTINLQKSKPVQGRNVNYISNFEAEINNRDS